MVYQGYVSRSYTNTSGMTKEAMLFCKTNIGGYFFDGFISVEHSHELTITQNPVETGASISDHAYKNPSNLTMKVIVSDCHKSIIDGQFDEGSTFRHVNAWRILKRLQEERIPVSVLTKLEMYNNMLIQSISAEDTDETINKLVATVVLQEIPVARVRTYKISLTPQITDGVEFSEINPEEITMEQGSLLYMIAQLFGWR